jgi:hypothetical protein
MRVRSEQPGKDIHNRATGQDIWERTAGTGQCGKLAVRGQAGQVSLYGTERRGWPEHDSKDATAGTGYPWQENHPAVLGPVPD